MQLRTTENWGRYAPNRLQNYAIKYSNAKPKSLFASLCRRAVLTGLNQPLDVSFWGAKFRLYPKDNLCEKRGLLSRVNFDAQERKILKQFMHKDFCFIDVGANIGLYSLFVAKQAGPGGKVLAIEPQPEIKQRLKFNLLSNPDCNITHLDCAVSDKKGLARMSISTSNRGASGFALRSGDAPDSELMVQTRTLADIISSYQMKAADALKIDIEGAEDQVLLAFFNDTANADLPKLLILERNQDWKIDCIDLAKAHGYKQILQAHMNVVLQKNI